MEINQLIASITLEDKTNKADELFNQLSHMIINKKIPSGYTFPNENNMCQMLSIGRGTLREVYKALELKNFITRSKAGTVVNDINDVIKKDTFDTSLLFSDKDNIVEFLLIVDSEAARLAANKITDKELEAVYEAMMNVEKANKELRTNDIVKYNSLFHQLIRDASHNPLLINSIISSRKKYDEIFVTSLVNDSKSSREFIDLCLMQHYNLYYALKIHDGEKAKEIMKEHFLSDVQYSESLITDNEETITK